VPASGNYVYLQSDNGDSVGAGRIYTYTSANALIQLSNSGLAVNAEVHGNETWFGQFMLPKGAGTLQAGYFKDLLRIYADNTVGGLEWGGGCNKLNGWVVIDKVGLTDGALTALDLRFEQRCEGVSPALHGQIHWTKADADSSQVAGPAAIPASLWQPAASAHPSTGTYLYLENPASDDSTLRSVVYTPANAAFTLGSSGAHLGLHVAGNQDVSADFQGMQGLTRLAVGYYSGLQQYPFQNPVVGGLSVAIDMGGCNGTGWFAVDKASYNGTTLTAVDLRFEQLCDGSTISLRGQLHWTADDTTTPPGPQNPPPTGLWTPGSAVAGLTGNYVYLVSDAGDYIGEGGTELITQDKETISVGPWVTGLRISTGNWAGEFVGMNTLSQLQPGYYGNIQRSGNPATGQLGWGGNGRGCSKPSGWFVVDRISYSQGEATAIDLRFEQHCDGAAAALHGAIHWTNS
jgi:hypothetical protein